MTLEIALKNPYTDWMALDLNKKVALVTGASKGIGRAIAIAFAKEGTSVAINFKSDSEAARAVLEECNRHSKGNILVQADVSVENEVSEMFKRIKNQFQHLDILVNNAGIIDRDDNPTNVEAFEKTFRNNLLGAVIVTKHAIPLMKKGKIINISSIHGRLGHGRVGATAYSALKAALENYTKNLAKDVAPNILVNAIAPGRVITPIWGDIDAAEQKRLGSGHLIKRMVKPEEIADGAIFLAKTDAVCGEVLTIDGGMGLAPLTGRKE